MNREEKIEHILDDLIKKGSKIEYLEGIKKELLDLTSYDIGLSEALEKLAISLADETNDFLNNKNEFDINYISGISSCIYFPSFDDEGEIKLKFIGGERTRNSKLKVDENTKFDVASITKLFTLTLLYIFDGDIVNLNDKIALVNPDYKGLGDFTFNDLIKMCGELYTNGNVALAKNKKEAYEILKTIYLKSDSRLENKYTDFGAIVMADTFVKLFNEKLGFKNRTNAFNLNEIMHAHIFSPLGMQQTTFNPKADNISGNGSGKLVHDPKARILGGAVGSAGLFTTSDDLAKFARGLYKINYINSSTVDETLSSLCITKEQLGKYGEITFPNSKQCNKGNLGIYVKHPLGFDKTYTPSEFSTGSFSHQGYTGSLATFDPNNLIHQNILVNAIYETDNKNLIRNDKPVGFSGAFDEYLKSMTLITMLMYVTKKYYNNYCDSYEDVDKVYKLK